MSENSNELGAFLAGFVIGGLVGAATAIILAPQSGAETRSQITGKSQELRTVSSERFQQVRGQADAYSQEYRGRAGEMLSETRDRVQQVGGQVQEQARIVLDAGKQRADQVKQQVNTLVNKPNGTASE